MKPTNLVICTLFSLSFNVYSQVKSNAEKIEEVFPVEFVAHAHSENSFYHKLLKERIQIEYSPVQSSEKYKLLSSVPLNTKYNSTLKSILESAYDPETFNPLAYQLPFFDPGNSTPTYLIDNTDY